MKTKKPSGPLRPHEIAFLKAGGAVGLESDPLPIPTSGENRIPAEYDQLIATSLTVSEVVERLGVSSQEVLDRINHGALYAIKLSSGYICPEFQFHGNAVLPALDVVLAAISKEANPLSLQRFFLLPTADLESNIGHPLSPREWLINGYSPDPVVFLAKDF